MTEAAARTDAVPGILPSQALRQLIEQGRITAAVPIAEAQIQPASLDLRLGPVAWRMRASFLPGPHSTVRSKVEALAMHEVDLTNGAVLERNCVYIVPLLENLALPPGLSATANPKSSTGRLDIFARIITDHGAEFDRIRDGYHGPLYAEVAPHAFSIRVRQGSRLAQLRVRRGAALYSDLALRRLKEVAGVAGTAGHDPAAPGPDIDNGLPFTVDVRGQPDSPIIGYKARRNTGLLDVDKINHYDPLDFWEPVRPAAGLGIILDPDDFYILASKEAVVVPPDHAAEMMAYDTLVGEFRVHYAGFFDPGFGYAATGGAGSRAVLEVRSHEVPFLIEDGQIVGRLFYEKLTATPDKLYGTPIGSSYQSQALRLSKQFTLNP